MSLQDPNVDLVARYPYAHALYADLHASLGHITEAREHLDRALHQQPSSVEQALLRHS